MEFVEGSPVFLFIEVEDVDAVIARALSRSATAPRRCYGTLSPVTDLPMVMR